MVSYSIVPCQAADEVDCAVHASKGGFWTIDRDSGSRAMNNATWLVRLYRESAAYP